MSAFKIVPIPQKLAQHVREHGEDPVYNHPAHAQPATDHAPCRVCLRRFEAAGEGRFLFTLDSFQGAEEDRPQPGPVFIHADDCERYAGVGFPEALHDMSLTAEGYARGARLRRQERTTGERADSLIADLLADAEVEYVQLRSTSAGCYVARAVRSAA